MRGLCGKVAVCSRPADHRGQHGGFRPLDRVPTEFAAAAEYEVLTPAQYRTVAAVARGVGYSEAARDLGISEQTLKNHMSDIHRQLGVTTAIGALRAIGWLRVPDGV